MTIFLFRGRVTSTLSNAPTTTSMGKGFMRSAASVLVTQDRTTAKKSRYLAVFEQKLLLKVVSVAKVKPKDSEGWWIQGLKRVF